MGNINDKFLLTQNNDDIYSSISQPFEQHENESFHDDIYSSISQPFEQHENESFHDDEVNIYSNAIFISKPVTSVEIKEEKNDDEKEKKGQNEIKFIAQNEKIYFINDKENKNKNVPKDGNEITKTNVNKETFKKEIYIKVQFLLFTKSSNEQNDIIKEYSEKPWFIDSDLVQKRKRINDKDNTAKKVKEAISETIEKYILGDKKNFFSFMIFNQKGTRIKNKEYLNMSLKELLLYCFIEKKKSKKNDYISTEDDKKFIESIANNDERKKYILNMKMEDIFNEFFESQEYRDLIKKLRNKEYNYYYIYTFIQNNIGFVEYYKNAKKLKKNNN